MGVSQSFSPGTSVQSSREKAADFPLLGFSLPLLDSSLRRGFFGAAGLPAGTHHSVPSAGPTHTNTSHCGAKIWSESQGSAGAVSLQASCPGTSVAWPCEEQGVQGCSQRAQDEDEGSPSEMSASSTSSESSLASRALGISLSPSPPLRFFSYVKRPERPSTLLFDAECCRHPRECKCG